MDKIFLDCKLYSYLARMTLAERVGDRERAKKAAGLAVVLLRMQARDAVAALVCAREEEKAAGRAMVKARESGITFPFGDQRLKQLEEASAQRRKELVEVGAAMSSALDLWQSYGATIRDLASLCNRSVEQAMAEIKPYSAEGRFSDLIFVHNLDYKDIRDRGWIDFDVDAPLTHAVKEYWLDLMLHTKEGREASHEALEKCFPEIMESALTLVTDADGVKHLIDRDGVEVGTLDGEEG